jgi:hypothetical protein
MTLGKLSYYQDLVSEDIRDDESRNANFRKVDDIYNCRWNLPTDLEKLPWTRPIQNTAGHDAIEAASRTIATQLPFINVMPTNANQGEKERAERVEALLDWHFFQMNRRGVERPLWQIGDSAVKYATVAFQVIYVPFEFKGQTGKQADAIRRAGEVMFKVHNAQNVHARYGNYALDRVSLAQNMTARQVVGEFGKERCAKLIAEIKSRGKPDDFDKLLERTWCTYFDLSDYDNRVQWVAFTDRDHIAEGGGGDKAIELRREEHGLKFLPWVFRTQDHYLMKPVVDADMYDNQNVLESFRFSLLVSMVAKARSKSVTLDGQGVKVDYKDPGQQVPLRPGEEYEPIPPEPMDVNLQALVEAGRGDIRQATVATVLTTLEKVAFGAPFSTVNAIIQAAVASLVRVSDLVETSIQDGLYQALQWIEKSGLPSRGFRRKGKSLENPELMQGAQLLLKPTDFSTDDLYITVKLNTDSSTDKQQRYNMAINAIGRLPVSARKAMEDNGLDYNDADEMEWLSEQYGKTELQTDLKRIAMVPDMEMQQAQAQQQMEMQQYQKNAQNEAQGITTETAMSGMQGVDNRGGGMNVQSPGMGREQITSESFSGEGLA